MLFSVTLRLLVQLLAGQQVTQSVEMLAQSRFLTLHALVANRSMCCLTVNLIRWEEWLHFEFDGGWSVYLYQPQLTVVVVETTA